MNFFLTFNLLIYNINHFTFPQLVLANSDKDDISRDSLTILSNVARMNEQIMTRMFAVRGMEETLFRLTNDPSRDKREVGFCFYRIEFFGVFSLLKRLHARHSSTRF